MKWIPIPQKFGIIRTKLEFTNSSKIRMKYPTKNKRLTDDGFKRLCGHLLTFGKINNP